MGIAQINTGDMTYRLYMSLFGNLYFFLMGFELIKGENKRKGIIVTILSGFTLGLSVLVFFRFINQI